MTEFRFTPDTLSQHFVKVLVEVRPPLQPATDRLRLQEYANWLIETHPEAFEVLICSHQQVRINKSFAVGGRTAEVTTFAVTPQGPLLQLPVRLTAGHPVDVEGLDVPTLFGSALSRLGADCPERVAARVSLIHEMIFFTGRTPALEVIQGYLGRFLQTADLTHARLAWENRRDGKILAYDLRPAYLTRPVPGADPEAGRSGVLVTLEIRALGGREGVRRTQIDDLLAFSGYYVPDELIATLNEAL